MIPDVAIDNASRKKATHQKHQDQTYCHLTIQKRFPSDPGDRSQEYQPEQYTRKAVSNRKVNDAAMSMPPPNHATELEFSVDAIKECISVQARTQRVLQYQLCPFFDP